MIVTKVTVGFVTQRYDTEKKRFIDQEFHAADDVTWETEDGEQKSHTCKLIRGICDTKSNEPYLNYEMIQPANHDFKIGDLVLATPDGNDNWHEFQGTVKLFRDNGNLITVKDQNDDCFDCRPGQLKHA